MALTSLECETKFQFTYTDELIFESPELAEQIKQALKNTSQDKLPFTSSFTESFLLQLYKPLNISYEIRFISEDIGYGVFASQSIAKGTYLGEYTGFVTTEPSYLSMNTYSFHYPASSLLDERIRINAKSFGNLTRLYNHSFQPKADKHLIIHNHLFHWIFIANQDLIAGDQITYDYGQNYWYLWGQPKAF